MNGLWRSLACGVWVILVGALSLQGRAQTPHDYLFSLVNQFRIEQGLEALVWDSCMWHAAKHQADYQCEMSIVTHGQTPFSKFKNWNAMPHSRIMHFCPMVSELALSAENCGASDGGFRTELDMTKVAQHHVEGWIRSPGHMENLLFNKGNDKGGRPPRAAVAISCDCVKSSRSVSCFATFVVREKAFSDR